ncbi:hypothetical protein IE077_003338 [Cardiosporidium cionae]|uniref:RRM domain-containing protein n=1 Tax=Cardiosporidium cionae TaxID=476202 RepID=A0ABQ7JF40_9APIC|nr:hypothetical protein IE077_003338 [Cardiosporidium cionae]|eukprot:KAF8822613.1 hypothetical protein IE077_003338 [Cardiosporidium cionae]
MSTEEFKSYFEKYGRVVDAVLMTDKSNNRPRGFGFVTFENPEVVEEVVRHYSTHQLRGKWVEVKKATPKEQMNRGGRSMTGGNLYGGNAGYPKWSYNGYGMDRRGTGNAMYTMYGGSTYYDAYQGGNAYGDGAGGRSDYASYGRPSPSGDTYGQQSISYTPGVGGGYGVGGGNRGYAAGYGAYDTIGQANTPYNSYGTSGQYAAAAGVYAQHGPQRGNRSVYGRSFPY